MFYIRRNAFCYFVQVEPDGVRIKPAGASLEMMTFLTPSIITSLKLIAGYITRGLHYQEREAALMSYFTSKGYRVEKVSTPDPS